MMTDFIFLGELTL